MPIFRLFFIYITNIEAYHSKMQQTPYQPSHALIRWPYAFAVLCFIVAYAIRYYLFPLDAGIPFTTFYPAIILSFYYVGFRAGLLTLVLSTFSAYYSFIQPYSSFELHKHGLAGLGFFFFTNVLSGLLIKQLHLSEIRFRTLLEDQTDVISRFKTDGTLIYANSAYKSLFGLADTAGKEWMPLVFEEDVPIVNQKLSLISFQNPVVTIENRIYDYTGRIRWYQFINHGIFDANKNLIEIQSVGRETTDVKQQQDLLNFIAYHDVLTGLPNRLLFFDRLHQAIISAKRRNNAVAVCFLDLNGFKKINDQYGHNAGDEVLIAVSRVLLEVVRESDTVSRMGGDEFMLIINDYKNEEGHQFVLDRLFERICQPIVLKNGVSVQITASVGLSQYPKDGEDPEALIQISDNRMYVAKVTGRNRLVTQ
jgi:diguanylate cyclase (GGDEF)-like protein/PAS domain S-box-containing protein